MVYLTVGISVFFRKLSYGLACSVQVTVKAEASAISQGHSELEWWVDVPNLISLLQLKVLIDRCIFGHHHIDSVEVMIKSRYGDLFRGESTADFISLLQYQYLQASFGQISAAG
jgi:hypothetical protein